VFLNFSNGILRPENYILFVVHVYLTCQQLQICLANVNKNCVLLLRLACMMIEVYPVHALMMTNLMMLTNIVNGH